MGDTTLTGMQISPANGDHKDHKTETINRLETTIIKYKNFVIDTLRFSIAPKNRNDYSNIQNSCRTEFL